MFSLIPSHACGLPSSHSMDFLKKLFTNEPDVDYYREGVELLEAGHYHEALTSFRLALREAPNDSAVLQQIAVAHTRIGLTDEAVKTYRQVLEREPTSPGAHYGLAFLLLRAGRPVEAKEHLRRFLDTPPDHAEAKQHIDHAAQTLERLELEYPDDERLENIET